MSKGKRLLAAWLAAAMMLALTSCGNGQGGNNVNLIQEDEKPERVVNLFSPMEKTSPNLENAARNAFDKTIALSEEKLGISMAYRTYTAENYQDRTYDQVTLDRVRNNMDDIYLLNPDIVQALGQEGLLMDLSGLESAKNLREIVRVANTVDGKLVAIPQEVVAYGLFLNKDMFDRYGLKAPNTPEEFLACCETFRRNGVETPLGDRKSVV